MSFLDELLGRGVLLATGVPGLYGRSADFEDTVQRLDAAATALGRDQGAERMRFPPAMPRAQLERSGYLKGFPHLAGTVHCFCGDEQDHRALLRQLECNEDWTGKQQASEAVLVPAACYPVYPTLAARGPLAEGGATVDVQSYCYRHEPSDDPARMQMFRMREYIRLGSAGETVAFRDAWAQRGLAFAGELGLDASLVPANDPFFGRSGRLMGQSQKEQLLKYELAIPVTDPDRPTACMSFNCHQNHFGEIWGLQTSDGAMAHTACVGFGLERLALALFRAHGLDPATWPAPVRDRLHDGTAGELR